MENSQLNRAELLLQQKRPKEAAQILTSLLAIDPNNVEVLALLSETALEMGQLNQAEELINNAIGLVPDIAPLHYIKSKVLIEQERFDKAEKSLINATTLDPSDADFYAIWAMVKNIRKEFSSGLDLSQRALELQPDNILALNARSTSLLKLDRKEESAATVAGALHEDPNNAFTHANYGWAELEKGSHSKALTHFKEALKNDPNMEYAQGGMIEALKARYFIYRIFLKYVFWISNLTSKYQWAVIIGFYLSYNLIRRLSNSNSDLAPFLDPLLVILSLIAFSTWITPPLSNLFLRLNQYGKHLLDKKEILSSNFVAICVLVALVGFGTYLLNQSILSLGLGIFGVGMMIPCSAIFSSAKVKFVIPTYTIAAFGLGLIALTNIYNSGILLGTYSGIFALSIFAFQWIANFVLIRENNY